VLYAYIINVSIIQMGIVIIHDKMLYYIISENITTLLILYII